MSQRTEITRWMASRRAAEARELAEMRRTPLEPSASFAAAIALIAFAAARHGWPLPEAEEAAADDLAFHEVWARLRRHAAIA